MEAERLNTRVMLVKTNTMEESLSWEANCCSASQ